MKTVWFKNLNEQQQEEMRGVFVHSVVLREQLKKLLNEKVVASNKSVRSKESYGIANWAYLQADAVGYERALTEVMSLLSHDPVDQSVVVAKTTETDLRPKRRGRPPKVRVP